MRLARRDRVMLAYVCISGVNVGEDDARALGDLIADTPVRLDLIDVTDPTGKFQSPTTTSCGPSAMRFRVTSHNRSFAATPVARISLRPAARWLARKRFAAR